MGRLTSEKAVKEKSIGHIYNWINGGKATLYGKFHPEGMKKYAGTTGEEVTEYVVKNQMELLNSLRGQDPDSRDKSRYAVNNFENDDLYTMYQPYETVSVAMPEGKKVKNVIFMIGDGMGLEQLSTAWVLNGGHLNITDNCTNVGLQWTYSANRLITDSAAAGTALATGSKTMNGRIAHTMDA